MKRLWAPWRMTYIKTATNSKACFLCAALRGRDNLVVHRGKRAFSILNKFPYNAGHLMVAPLRHKGRLEQLSRDELGEIFDQILLMKRVLQSCVKPHGYNIGINVGRTAGAGLLGHIHVHIVPRWNGDTNYMPVVGATKVMPVSLEELHAKFAAAARKSRQV